MYRRAVALCSMVDRWHSMDYSMSAGHIRETILRFIVDNLRGRYVGRSDVRWLGQEIDVGIGIVAPMMQNARFI